MDLEPIARLESLLNSLFTLEESIRIFGEEDGCRLYHKHWSWDSKNQISIFNTKFSIFAEGKYSHYRPEFDKWLEEQYGKMVLPSGYKLVKISEETIT